MNRNPNRLWIAALLLGWSFDFLFWKKPAGVNFPIFAGLSLLGGLALLLWDGIRPSRRGLWLLLPLTFFAAVTVIRSESMTALLAYALTLFCLSLFALTYLGGRWAQYGVSDYVSKYLGLALSVIGRPLSFQLERSKERAESGGARKRGAAWPVVRGLLIALPIVAVFASLLGSADLVFGQQLDKFVQLFRLEKLPEYLFRLFYILVGAYMLAGVLLHAAFQSGDEKLYGQEKPLMTRYLGFTETSIILGSVGLLFLIFVIIQFRYFFGGNANIHLDGYTYSEYARRGFGELVAVAFFTLLLLLALGSISRRENPAQARTFSALGAGLVAMVLVMLVSAYQRLVLYEAVYGFSRLRAYTHVVLYWIALLLVATIVLEIFHRERHFAFAAVLAAVGFAVSLSLLNVDAFIVRQNLEREFQRQSGQAAFDSHYLLALSDDAVPAIVQAYTASSTPASIKDQLGAALVCMRLPRDRQETPLPWQSFHFSRYYADQAYAQVNRQLDAYKVVDKDWPPKVKTASGDYPCSQAYAD